MSKLVVKFLEKEYSFPQDVLTYIELLDFTDGIQKQLANVFVRKLRNEIAKDNIGLLGDEDLATEIEQQVGKFIAKLCDYGIFTRTISDYLKNNKGYQLYSDVNKAALEKMKSILINEIDDWQAGYENAVNKAESNITGMGFSIWSGSFVNHAIYAAMEASTINKQEKEAQAQYQKDMNDLSSRLDSQYGGEKSNYINNTYIPNMEAALTVLAYELLDQYVNDLIVNEKFDRKTLDFVDIGRSNDLLKNLTLSNNKKAILENSFIACPYNIAVYMQAMKYGLLDFDSFQTAKLFKQSDEILSFLKENWGEVSYPTKFNINYHSIDILSLLTGKNATDLLRSRAEPYATGIVKAYSRVVDALNNKELCCKIIREFDDASILAGDAISKSKAHSFVDSIVTPTIWNQLIDKCGQTDLLDRIKTLVPADVQLQTKEEIDDFLIEKLTIDFEEARQKLIVIINDRNKENEKRAKEEAERKERERQKRKRYIKTFATITPIAIVIISIFICLFKFLIIPNSRYKSAVELYHQGQYEDAIDIFQTMQGYKDSSKYIVDAYIFLDDYKSAIAYNDAYNGTEMVIPDGITKIKANAFCDAENITSVVIPDSVSVIETKAFIGCDSLTRVTIPSSIISIQKGAFDDCKNLADVHIGDLTQWCQIKFEDLTSSPMHYGNNLYLNGELLTDITVPDNLTGINEYAFASWDCLVNVAIGNNITNINPWAFAFCDNLKNVTLPGTITSIKESTFNGCNSLADITIPKNVEDIGEDAFNDCNALINVVIPSNVDSIGKSAFAHCDNLTTFSFPDGIKTIERYMFYPCESLQTVKIPNSVSSIGKWAFRDCLKLTTIEFNGTIGEWKALAKEDEWDYQIGQYTIYCTDGQISAAQNTIFESDVGDVITLGSYEQDGNTTNGAEEIEWIVLKKEGNKAFVISRYCIEQKPFNNKLSSVTWENCSLRKWLNNDFYNIAFKKLEQEKIISSKIQNIGNSTTDKIFLLSENEATEYFESDSERSTYATDYVSTSHCYWLLRTTGSSSNVAHVDYEGKVGYYENVDRNWWVRPAMWIEIDG